MHVFVTGGTGFFGKALLRHWQRLSDQSAQAGFKATLLSRNPERFSRENAHLLQGLPVSLHQGDILDPASLPRPARFTHILHAATDSTTGPQLTPLERYDQIVTGTRNVLDLALETGAKRLLMTSSGGVYGPQPPGMQKIPETYCGMPDPMEAGNAYSVGKRTAEHLCALYANRYDLDVVVARCFAFVGQDLPLDVHFAIGNFIRDALHADAIVVGGDGTPVRSYLHQDDLAVWLMTMLHKGQNGRAYNLGSDEGVSIAELAHLVRDLVAPGKPVRIQGVPDASNKKNRYVPDIYRAQDELGLKVSIGLREAITRTVAGLR